MKVTGERFIPHRMSLEAEIEHYHRYQSVVNLVTGKIVLDAACGTGYGASMLAQTANFVHGLDISKEAIIYAEEYYGCENIEFHEGSVIHLDFPDEYFDVVVSFETIEHISEAVQLAFLKEIKRVLKRTGILIMSTPNKKTFTEDRHMLTPFHLREFYEDEFFTFIQKSFLNLKLYHQYFAKTSCMVEYLKDEHLQTLNFDAKKRGFFLIAIASNADISNIGLNSVYYFPDDYLKKTSYLQAYFEENGQLKEKNSEVVWVDPHADVNSIEIKFDGINTHQVRIDPLEVSCELEILEIVVTKDDLSLIIIEDYQTNCDSQQDSIYTFYHNDPQVIITFPEALTIQAVTIQYKIIRIQFDLYPYYEQCQHLAQYLNSLTTAETDDIQITQLDTAFSEIREKVQLLDRVLEDERNKSTTLEALLNESRGKEQLLNKALDESRGKEQFLEKVMDDERSKSTTLLALLEESRGKEEYVNKVLDEERSVAASLTITLQKKIAEFREENDSLQLKVDYVEQQTGLLEEEQERLVQQLAEKSSQLQDLHQSHECILKDRSYQIHQKVKKFLRIR